MIKSKKEVAMAKLSGLDACDKSRLWLARQKSIEHAWKNLKNFGWLSWLLSHTTSLRKKAIAKTKKIFTQALKEMYPRCAKAINTLARSKDPTGLALEVEQALQRGGYAIDSQYVYYLVSAYEDLVLNYFDDTLTSRIERSAPALNDTTLLKALKAEIPAETVFNALKRVPSHH